MRQHPKVKFLLLEIYGGPGLIWSNLKNRLAKRKLKVVVVALVTIKIPDNTFSTNDKNTPLNRQTHSSHD